MAEAISLMGGMRLRMRPALRWNASIAASVPWPSASGASVKTMTPLNSPPSATTAEAANAGWHP